MRLDKRSPIDLRSELGAGTMMTAVMVVGVMGAVIGGVQLLSSQRAQETTSVKEQRSLEFANISALQTAMELYARGVIKQQGDTYNFESETSGKEWSVQAAKLIVKTCNPNTVTPAEFENAMTLGASSLNCSGQSAREQISSSVEILSVDEASGHAIIEASSKRQKGADGERIVKTRAKMPLAEKCTDLLKPGAGIWTNVTWNPDGHGWSNGSSLVWVMPSLHPGGYVGENYEFKFKIYWQWGTEKLDGYSPETMLSPLEGRNPNLVGSQAKDGKSLDLYKPYKDRSRSWGTISDTTCNGAAGCATDCMTGASCNSREFTATIPKAKDGTCELIVTAGGFKKRGGDGCFAPDTRVTMASGERRAVASLVEGDQLLNPLTGKPTTVKRLIAGPEFDAMYEIWAGQRKLVVTSGHPVLTKAGDRRADQLVKGDVILLGDGEHAVVEEVNVLNDSKGGTVYNVELSDGSKSDQQHYMIADGMITGDIVIQGRMADKQLSMK